MIRSIMSGCRTRCQAEAHQVVLLRWLLNPAPHLVARGDARTLEHDLPATKNHKMRNSLDPKAGCKVGVFFSVGPKDNGLSSYIAGQRFHLGRRHAARSAPRGPEINQNRDASVLNYAIEGNRIDVNGLCERWQNCLAGPASPGVS